MPEIKKKIVSCYKTEMIQKKKKKKIKKMKKIVIIKISDK